MFSIIYFILIFFLINSAILEAKRYKASGGDMLADMLDLLDDKNSILNHTRPTEKKDIDNDSKDSRLNEAGSK